MRLPVITKDRILIYTIVKGTVGGIHALVWKAQDKKKKKGGERGTRRVKCCRNQGYLDFQGKMCGPC